MWLCRHPRNLTLRFTGFFDSTNKKTVNVEAKLFKLCHKKRKDVCSPPIIEIEVGQCEVPCNPDPLPTQAIAFTIPSHHFTLTNGHLVKSYVLVVRVALPLVNGIQNGEEHPNDNTMVVGKKRKAMKEYAAELVVYDKQQQCLLTDGTYQLALRPSRCPPAALHRASWETCWDTEDSGGNLANFVRGPLVAFHLAWSDNFLHGPVTIPSSAMASLPPVIHPGKAAPQVEERRKQRIFYQFVYNNNTRQQTEAREDLRCPWCSLNCLELYCLLKHLKLCHSRFHFNYVPHPKGARIDVSINEGYDGSYVGNPHDLHCHTGFTYTRSGPVRRMAVTYVLVCRPKRLPPSLSEFLESEDVEVTTAGSRAYVCGHNRLYFHTGTCLPVQPHELEMDSEAETAPEWLCFKTQQMIDDFTDVNEGEKELVKLWNLHVMQNGFVGDCQAPLACSLFVQAHGREILARNLYMNFLLHLANLFDFGIISTSTLYSTVLSLQMLKS
ncbi:SUZ12 [Cordylochernes scorpioides]|uniref:SUZ12 n=1 Tax=Cordylochernes scorpioides TaxID=51811 RepID=A0ABY6L8E5_9ARAC|nr:SUZ12 [Cordylochernes scorpioides]